MWVTGLNWGDVPTWVTAFGTVGAVVVALYLAGRDSRQRARERRRHQADNITGWLEFQSHPDQPPTLSLTILNGSSQLAYRVIASLVPVRGTAPPDWRNKGNHEPKDFREFVGELRPGTTTRAIEYPGGGSFIRWAVELTFRDAAGQVWLRSADGRLNQIKDEPAAYYGLHEPLPW